MRDPSPPQPVSGLAQRDRLMGAMLRASAELGYRDVEPPDVSERAGFPEAVFYEHFRDPEDCFLAALDETIANLSRRIGRSTTIGEDWRESLQAGLRELLCFVGEEPEAAMALFVDSRCSCPAALRRRDALLDSFASCIDSRVRLGVGVDGATNPSALTAAGIVGGIEALVHSRLARGRALEPELPAALLMLLDAPASLTHGVV